MREVRADGVGIHGRKVLIESADVEASCLFSDASFEFCERHCIDKGHLALYPGAERLLEKRIRVEYDFLIPFEFFADIE